MLENKEEELYNKYMAFNQVMLEEYDPIEIAAIMIVQGLTFYRTVMTEEDYQKIVESIYNNKDNIMTFTGPNLQ